MSTQETQLRSEAVQDILTEVPNWMIRWGNTIIFLLLAFFIGLSWLIQYPDIISASALITTELPPQKEYARSGGKLKHILVSNGEGVWPGQDLAVITNPANYQDVKHLKSIVDTILYSRKEFDFPIHQMPLLLLGDIDIAYAQFENDYLQYDHNRSLKPIETKRLSQRFTAGELKLRLDNLLLQQKIQRNELQFRKTDLDRDEQLFKENIISPTEYEQKQMSFMQAERGYEATKIAISQMKESISNANKDKQLEEGTNSMEEVRLLRNTIQSFNQLKKAIYDWEARYVLRSEIRGYISFLDFWSINQEVNAGDLLFTIIPDQNHNHLAKLRVPALNSGKLTPGQKVFLKLDNYPDTEFGKLESTVATISAIPDKEGNYLVDVLLPEVLITTYNRKVPFQSEMTGTAEVVTADLRLIDRLFRQFRELLDRS